MTHPVPLSPVPPVQALSGREQAVLALIATGLSNTGIAARLGVSAKTVDTHVRNLFTKLHLPPDDDRHRRVLATLHFLDTTGGTAP